MGYKFVIAVCIAVGVRPFVYDNYMYLIVCMLLAVFIFLLGETFEKIKKLGR